MEYRNYYTTPRDAVSDDMLAELLGENEPSTEKYGNYNKTNQSLNLRNESGNNGGNMGGGAGCQPCTCKNNYKNTAAMGQRSTPNCRGEYPAQVTAEKPEVWQNPTLYGNQLAMVYAPVQEFEALYDEEDALSSGTIFKLLDLPFYPGCSGCGCKGGCMR